jgi:hypothetical protein
VLTCLAGSASINSRQYPVLGRAQQNGCSDMLGLSGASMCCTPVKATSSGVTQTVFRAQSLQRTSSKCLLGRGRGASRGSLSVESASRATSSPAQVRERPYLPARRESPGPPSHGTVAQLGPERGHWATLESSLEKSCQVKR